MTNREKLFVALEKVWINLNPQHIQTSLKVCHLAVKLLLKREMVIKTIGYSNYNLELSILKVRTLLCLSEKWITLLLDQTSRNICNITKVLILNLQNAIIYQKKAY